MKIEFQEDILKFFLQSKDGKKYIPLVDATLFDVPELQTVLDLLQDYLKEYRHQPSKGGLLQHWVNSSKKLKTLTKEVNSLIEDSIREAFEPLQGDVNLVKKELLEHAQYRKAAQMVKEHGPKLKEGPEVFKRMFKDMREILELDESKLKKEERKSGFVLADHDKEVYEIPEGEETFLKSLNRMTAAGGFYSPQLIIFLKGPKQFGTGLLINLAVNYMRDGLKVYYADFENGERSIKGRIKQCIAECELADLRTEEVKTKLKELVKRYKYMGGDMMVRKFNGKKDSIDDVAMHLDELKEEHNWEPEVIFWDYPDIVEPVDKTIREERLKINAVYHDMIRLQDERNLFGIGISPVNRNAIGKETFDIKDLGEDFKKSFNAHAIFAICCTPEEEIAGIRRIIPVVQREGVSYKGGRNVCVVRVDEPRMQVKELSFEEANAVMEALEQRRQENQPTNNRHKKSVPKDQPTKKSLTDE